MVAPRARTIFSGGLRERHAFGITLACPDCPALWQTLRCETADDYPPSKCPDLVGNAGPLGFVVRCDSCGFRAEMHGDRLPTVSMMKEANDG